MSESWRIERLDRAGVNHGPFGRVEGGSLEWNVDRQVWGSGTVEISNPPDDIDWFSVQFRISAIIDGDRTPMGVWVPAYPEWKTKHGLKRASIRLLDRTGLLNRVVPQLIQYPVGQDVMDRVLDICRSFSTDEIAFTPSSATLRSAIVWEQEVMWIKVVNDLLAAIGFTAVHADGNGWLRSDPWVEPAQRPVVATYGRESADLRVVPEWTDTLNVDEVPNRVVAYSKSDQNTQPLRALVDLPAEHPLSWKRRGHVQKTYSNVEATDSQALLAYAQRMLLGATSVTRRIQYRHPVDGTQMTDKVRLRTLGVTGQIINRKVTLGVGAVVEDTIRATYSQEEQAWI